LELVERACQPFLVYGVEMEKKCFALNICRNKDSTPWRTPQMLYPRSIRCRAKPNLNHSTKEYWLRLSERGAHHVNVHWPPHPRKSGVYKYPSTAVKKWTDAFSLVPSSARRLTDATTRRATPLLTPARSGTLRCARSGKR